MPVDPLTRMCGTGPHPHPAARGVSWMGGRVGARAGTVSFGKAAHQLGSRIVDAPLSSMSLADFIMFASTS